MDTVTLVRNLIRPEKAALFDEVLRRHPPQPDGRLDLGVLDQLIEQGVIEVRSLVEAAADHPVEPIPPTQVAANRRFAPLALLGAGAMGQVYLVHDTVLNRHVAFKVLEPSLARDVSMRQRFHHEVQITAQLDHPSIVSVYDLEQGPDGTVSYSMKLVRGQTLQDLIDAARAAPTKRDTDLENRLEIFLDVCDAMAYAHRRGIVHRDLKPENIMVGAFHQVLVMDWGIARTIGGAEELPVTAQTATQTHKTQVGVAIGTPAYMSPEQARGENDTLDGRSDQYTLGLILQELVTLKRARKGQTSAHTLYLAMEGERATVQARARPRRIPRELVAIIDKATAVQPDRRYPSVEALAEDIRRFLRDEPVLARPDTFTQRTGRWIARHRTFTLALGLLLVSAVVALALLAVAAGVAINEFNRWQAAEREARLGELQRSAADQAQHIEAELLRIEGHLHAIAGAAEAAFLNAPPDVPVFLAEAYKDPATAPPDTLASPVYPDPVSLAHPDVRVATSVEPSAVLATQRRLAGLGPVLRRAIEDSLGAEIHGATPAGIANRIRSKPAPIVWSYAATADGVMVGYPGAGTYPEDYDPRTRPWYLTAIDARAPVWSALDADEAGLGLLLTCAMPFRGPDDRALGVAAVDLPFGHVIDALLDPPALRAPVEAWLIDPAGNVIVRSSQKEQARTVPDDWTPPPFPYAALLDQIQGSSSGGTAELKLDDTRSIAVWRPVRTVGWIYLITGATADLL